jgi:CheY-like chemotaxis protein
MARILLVEDDEEWVYLIREALAQHVVHTANSYDGAMEALRQGVVYDVAIVDLNLVKPPGPGARVRLRGTVRDMLGGNILDLLRKEYPQTRRIALTGLPPGKVREILDRYDVDDLLLKGDMTVPAVQEAVLASLGSDPQAILRAESADAQLKKKIGPPKKMPKPHSSVFISYVREDSKAIDRLTGDLRHARIRFWLDRKNLRGGQRWKPAIRDAIQAGSAVIVCFSTNYSSRSKTYMNEELTQIIDELRSRPAEKSWLIPVRLNDCTIPALSISGHETLHDLQHIDMFPDWDTGIGQIVTALRHP